MSILWVPEFLDGLIMLCDLSRLTSWLVPVKLISSPCRSTEAELNRSAIMSLVVRSSMLTLLLTLLLGLTSLPPLVLPVTRLTLLWHPGPCRACMNLMVP